MTAERLKDAPGAIKHKVTNEQLASIARRAAIRYSDASRPLQAKTARVLRALARLKLKQDGSRRMSSVHLSTRLSAQHQRLRSDSSPAALLTAWQRLSIRRLSSALMQEQQPQQLLEPEKAAGADLCRTQPNTPEPPPRAGRQRRRGSLANTLSNLWRGGSDMNYYLGMISLEGVDHVLPRVRQKLTVVLDLDECLVHSVFPNGDKYRQSEARPENINLVDSMHLVLGGVEPVVVNRRPGLTKFLEQLSVDYHVVVFTAGRKEYAEEVLDAIDPQGTFFHHRLYRCSCRQARGNIYLKDLDRVTALERSGECPCLRPSQMLSSWHTQPVGEALERTVLVDNSPLSFICQPSNGILVSSWYDDPHDNALSSVLKLIRHLDACDDVRPTLTALFGLEPVLKEYQEFVLTVDEMDGNEGSKDCVRTQPTAAATAASQQAKATMAAPSATTMDDIRYQIDVKLHRKPRMATVADTGSVA